MMYVNPFIAGILATLMAEVVVLVGYALWEGRKK